MFTCDRKTALAALERIGAEKCVYTFPSGRPWTATRCDCKYGHGDPSRAGHSEVTGCPELRTLQLLLKNLPDSLFRMYTH